MQGFAIHFFSCSLTRRLILLLVIGVPVGVPATAFGSDPGEQDASERDLRVADVSPSYVGREDRGAQEQRERAYAKLAEEVEALQRRSRVLRTAVKLVRPSVVHIEADKRKTASDEYEYRDADEIFVAEAGSGIIVRLNEVDYVLTNRHVVHGSQSDRIRIKLSDGRLIFPTEIWDDRTTDIAVLGVGAKRLIPARLGNSQKVGIGDTVLAIGSPFGLSQSVTQGIISAKGRRDLQLGAEDVGIQDFLQTDAAINPGNSGGPLLNIRGEVIGLNTAIASSSGGNEGIGFSIPINMAMHVARQLVENGQLHRAYLGVSLDAKFAAAEANEMGLLRLRGTRVKSVTTGSPAEEADIVSNDIIIRYNHIDVEDDSHLVNLVSLTPPGVEIPVVVFREGEMIDLAVTVGERTEEP